MAYTPIVLTPDGLKKVPLPAGETLDPAAWLLDPADQFLTTQNGLLMNLGISYTNATRTMVITGKAGQVVGTILLPAASATIPGLVMTGQGLSVNASGLIAVALQSGGGLTFDSSGRIFVDFSLMPTDKFEALLKSLRIPIWLSRNTIWYVDSVNGNDANDGSTQSLAFKTLPYALQTVCDNYNFSNYTATFQLMPGDYVNTQVVLPKYTAGTGYAIIRGMDDQTVLRCSGTVNASRIMMTSANNAGRWDLFNFQMVFESLRTDGTQTSRGINAVAGTQVTLNNIDIIIQRAATSAEFIYVLWCNNGASITLNPTNRINYTSSNPSVLTGITALYGAEFYLRGNSGTNQVCLDVNGNFNNTLDLTNKGLLERNVITLPLVTGTVVGRRANIRTQAVCDTKGGGNEYFPGTTPITVDTAGFAVYK